MSLTYLFQSHNPIVPLSPTNSAEDPSFLEAVTKLIAQRERWTEKEQTQADVEVLILDHLFTSLPSPPFTDDEKQTVAKQVYQHVWQQSASGHFGAAA